MIQIKHSKLVLLTLLFLKSTILIAQFDSTVIGNWKVNTATMNMKVPQEQQQMLNNMKLAFQKSTFDIKKNRHFVFNIDIPNMSIKDGYWQFNATSNLIEVYEWKDRGKKVAGLLMDFEFRKEKDGDTFFLIKNEGLNITLKVEKVK